MKRHIFGVTIVPMIAAATPSLSLQQSPVYPFSYAHVGKPIS